MLREFAHMAKGAARPVVQHSQHDGALSPLYACHIQREAIGLRRICLHKCHDLALVAGVQASQGFHGGPLARAFAVAKAHATGVQHKGV